MAGVTKFETTNAQEVIGRLRKKLVDEVGAAKVGAVVGARATTPIEIPRMSGGAKNRAFKSMTEPRSAGKNVIILRTQAKKGRKVGFLTSSEYARGSEIWRRSISQQMRSGGASLLGGAKTVAEYLITVFRQHIATGRGEGGMKPLKDKYRAYKKRIFGGDQPALVATGQLFDSFVPEARRLK